MCGRTSQFVPLQDLESRFDATYVAESEYSQRFNIAPGEPLEVVTGDAPDEIDRYTWGLVPFWADDPDDAGWINARSETAHEKPAFRAAWKNRPCLVLSSGFYEWQAGNGGPKRPYRIYREDEPAFAMAGLWETWEGDDGDSLRSLTILTTDANDLVSPIHDRMPVVLPRAEEATWVDGGPDERRDLCVPYPGDDLDAYPISRTVNDPDTDGATIIEPHDGGQSKLDSFS